MKKLIDRVHAIVRNHPDGISSPDICKKLNSDKPHKRCMVAHVLTQLYRAKKVDRESISANSAKTYVYKATMKSIDFVKKLIRDNPGISSSEIRETFASARNQSGDVASTILTNLTQTGKIIRSKVKKGARISYCYSFPNLPATSMAQVVPVNDSRQEELIPAKIDAVQAAQTGTVARSDELAHGMELAAQICEMQAKMSPGDTLYAAICFDCAKRIRQFAV